MRRLTDTERQVLEMIHEAGGSYLADSHTNPAAKEMLHNLVKKRRLIWEETDGGTRYHLAQGWSV